MSDIVELGRPTRHIFRLRVPGALTLGVTLLGVMGLLCALAPYITSQDPLHIDAGNTFLASSWEHPFGTDELGRDVLARLLYGGRLDISIALLAVIAPLIVGAFMGALSGMRGGWVDVVIMRVADIISAFPFYVLVIALVFVLGTGMHSVFIAIGIVSWVPYCRLVRAETLRIREADYVLAARTGGVGGTRIIARHVLPNVMGEARTYAVSDAAANIHVIVTLSYFGLGLVPPAPDWGQMLASGQQFIGMGAYQLVLIPAIAIMITSFALSLIGDGLMSRLRGGRR